MASIAVITPTIPGRESQLEECVNAVKSQTVPVWHAVVVDEKRQGPSWARNKAVSQCTEDWLLPLDDDDLIDPDFVETLLPHLTDDVDIVYPWHHDIDGMDGLTFNRLPNFDLLTKINFIPITSLIRRSVWEEVGGWPEPPERLQPGEDWDFWRLCLGAGAVFKCVPEVLWSYRVSENTRNNWK